MEPFRAIKKFPIAVIFFILAGVIVFVACGSSGRTARDFEVAQFDGNTFRMSEETYDNAVVVNFWYPSCPPCREEMPAIESAWQDLKDLPVRVLSLYVPQGFDSEQDAQNFVGELGLTFDFATDRLGRIAEAYEVEYFPTTFFLDMEGEVVATHISIMQKDEVVRQVKAIIGGPPS